MTINELRDYLAKYTGEGKGNTLVTACDKRDNPTADGMAVTDALFIEWKDGGCQLILQIG
jgi:hypothetical protein